MPTDREVDEAIEAMAAHIRDAERNRSAARTPATKHPSRSSTAKGTSNTGQSDEVAELEVRWLAHSRR